MQIAVRGAVIMFRNDFCTVLLPQGVSAIAVNKYINIAIFWAFKRRHSIENKWNPGRLLSRRNNGLVAVCVPGWYLHLCHDCCVLSGTLFIIIQSCFAEWFVADSIDY
jgi:hypothetical protein